MDIVEQNHVEQNDRYQRGNAEPVKNQMALDGNPITGKPGR